MSAKSNIRRNAIAKTATCDKTKDLSLDCICVPIFFSGGTAGEALFQDEKCGIDISTIILKRLAMMIQCKAQRKIFW